MAAVLSAPVAASASRLGVMNFLNEIAEQHPQAISFASGRPTDRFFDIQNASVQLAAFIDHQARLQKLEPSLVFSRLSQYGRTNGIINDLIAQQVGNDEAIACHAGQVLVTAGCQEAMDLCATTLCRRPGDAILVKSPTYIGITGVADLNGIPLVPFSCEGSAGMAGALREAVQGARREGLRPRVLYLVPDFDNPTGVSLDRAAREAVIAYCADEGIVVLEDNPYRMFRFEGDAIPTMHSLDRHGCVIYLGTYSKTVCPALRIGFAILPRRLFGDAGRATALMGELSQAKSFGTVNTSQVAQAIVGGVLLQEKLSLRRSVARATAHYRANRDAMVQALGDVFGSGPVRWNVPAGGFFLTVALPFAFGQAEAQACAGQHGVLVMPLSFFAIDDAPNRGVRLAFSSVARERIPEGIARFAGFVNGRIG